MDLCSVLFVAGLVTPNFFYLLCSFFCMTKLNFLSLLIENMFSFIDTSFYHLQSGNNLQCDRNLGL